MSLRATGMARRHPLLVKTTRTLSPGEGVRRDGGNGLRESRDRRSAGLQTGIARAAGETPLLHSPDVAARNGDGPTPFASGAPVFTPASPRAAGRNSRRYSPHGTARNGDGATPPTRPPWRFAVPGQARWISEHGGGSFAAFGRDAGLKTGAPYRLVRRVRSDRGPDRLHRHFRAVAEELASSSRAKRSRPGSPSPSER